MISRWSAGLGLVLVVGLPALADGGDGRTVVPAEKAFEKTVGGAVPGGGWDLWSNGWIGQPFQAEAEGPYAVVVRAWGSPALGEWPSMSLLVDGRVRADVRVDSADRRDYRFEVALAPGHHDLAVAFGNDAVVGQEDRNLYVESIAIDSPEGKPAVTLTDGSGLRADREAREREVVAEANAAIERDRKLDAVIRVVHSDGRPAPRVPIDVVQSRQDFLFGCNIYEFDRSRSPKVNADYKDRFAGLFNYATVGFYWASYEPERGKPNYEYTDRVVSWCQGQGIAMKGHPLLWDHEAGRPKWAGDKVPSLEIQKARVEAILGRYKGKITLYEVVNEPAHIPTIPIDEPYRWARAADPSAKLIVNDYAVMADGYPPFRRFLEAAIRDGVPFDGVGIQAHEPVGMRFPLDRVRDVLDQYAKLGKELHITEFTPPSGGQPILGSHVQGTWDEAAQADYAEKFYRICYAHPAVKAITWWDLSDQGAWQKGGGLLRADMSPKPAYEQLRRLIRNEWMTRASGKTGPDGRFPFRGFPGTYRVGVKAPGGPSSRPVTLHRDGPRELVVTIP